MFVFLDGLLVIAIAPLSRYEHNTGDALSLKQDAAIPLPEKFSPVFLEHWSSLSYYPYLSTQRHQSPGAT